MAGKTGTSQVRIITAAERAAGVTANEQLPWNRRDHALFVCYAPYDNPKYAVAQIVEHGGGGSAVAAPIARDILLYALCGGLPPLEAYPPEQRKAIEEQRAAQPAPAAEAPAAAPGAGPGMSLFDPSGPRRPARAREAPRAQLVAGAAPDRGRLHRLPDALLGRRRLAAALGGAADGPLRRRAARHAGDRA